MNSTSATIHAKGKRLVLIPSARFVDPQMRLEVGEVPPVLIPVHGKPLLESIIAPFATLSEETHFALMIGEGAAMLKERLQLSRNAIVRDASRFRLVEVPLDGELGAAVRAALEQLPLDQYQSIVINFGDTLIESTFCGNQDTIFYCDLHESFRWTSFSERDGRIVSITDRFTSEDAQVTHVFSGVFLLQDPKAFLAALSAPHTNSTLGSFYSALLTYLANRDYQLEAVKSWHDFGHVDNYFEAKKRFVNKRVFNEITIDERRAILKKRSNNIEKFSGEIKWYLELPSSLKCYCPQIYDYGLSRRDTFIKMEYYGYPSLSDLYVFGGHNLGIWHHALEAVFRVHEEMKSYRLTLHETDISHTLYAMYVEKTRERLDTLAQDKRFQKYFDSPLAINGCQYHSLNHYRAAVASLFERVLDKRISFLSVVHGDFCLSNILFDPKSRIIKLVDPRGRFGEHTIYGDFRYELAKLSHSLNGHYESIISDAFHFHEDAHGIHYEIPWSDYQQSVTQMFNKRLDAIAGEHRTAIAAIEALLFLSMVPLHRDHLDRQVVMLATGVEKIAACLAHEGEVSATERPSIHAASALVKSPMQ